MNATHCTPAIIMSDGTVPCYDGLLTIKELHSLTSAPCMEEKIKQASFLAIFSGLTYEKIQELTYGQLRNLRLPNSVFRHYDGKSPDHHLVFENLPDKSWLSVFLNRWKKSASIRHRLTFHGFCHTHLHLTMQDTDLDELFKSLHLERI